MLGSSKETVIAVFSRHEPVVRAVREAALEVIERPRMMSASNPSDCCAELLLVAPALVVLDDSVCDGNGEALALLDRILAVQSRVPVIYIARRHTHDLERSVRRRGVLSYFEKPRVSTELDFVLTRFIARLLGGQG